MRKLVFFFLFVSQFCSLLANHTFFNWEYFRVIYANKRPYNTYIDSLDATYEMAKRHDINWHSYLEKLAEDRNVNDASIKLFFNGVNEYYNGNVSVALSLFNKALSIKDKENKYITGQILLYKGLCERDLNQLKDSENELKVANHIFLEYPDALMRSHAQYLLGTVRLRLSDYAEAEKYFNKALEYREQIKDTFNIIDAKKGLALLYRETGNFDKCLRLLNQSVSLIKKIDAKNMLSSTYNLSGSVNWRTNNYTAALDDYKNALTTQHDNKLSPKILNNIALVYKDIALIDSALYYLNKSKQTSIELGDSTELLKTFIYFGNAYLQQNNLVPAFQYYLEALELEKNNNSISTKAILYKNIGNIYLQVNLLEKSEEYLLAALQIQDSLKQKRISASIKGLLADNYIKRGSFEKALSILTELLSVEREFTNPKDLIVIINKTGDLYFEKGDYLTSVKYYAEALELSKQNKFTWHIANELNNLGNTYSKLQKKSVALNYFLEAIENYTEAGNLLGVALCSRKAGEIYLEQNHLVDAMPYIQQSIAIGEKIKNFELLKNGYYAKYQYYLKDEKYKEALEDLTFYHAYKDSTTSELNENKIIEIHLQYEIEEYSEKINLITKENNLLNAQKTKQESELDKQRVVIWFISIILFILTISAIALYNSYRLKKRTNSALDEKIKIIEQMNEKLTESECNLQRLNFTKDKIFSIIAHDLKNPMGAILNASSLLREDYDSMKEEDKKVFTEILFESSNQLYHLLENLLQWSRNQSGRIKYSPEKLDINKLANETIMLFKLNAEKKKIKLVNKCQDAFFAWADRDMINAVMRNLVSNAIKFTPDKGKVEIAAKNEKDKLIVIVKDSGIGIDNEHKEKLFDLTNPQSRKGTNMESGTGLGLFICKEFVEKNNGEFWFQTEENKGTSFYFSLPFYDVS